jgi:hypothetical protein
VVKNLKHTCNAEWFYAVLCGPNSISQSFYSFDGVRSVVQERRSLSLTLNDTKTVVKKLKHVLDALLWAIIVIIWLTILGIASTNLWVVASSLLIRSVRTSSLLPLPN